MWWLQEEVDALVRLPAVFKALIAMTSSGTPGSAPVGAEVATMNGRQAMLVEIINGM